LSDFCGSFRPHELKKNATNIPMKRLNVECDYLAGEHQANTVGLR